MRLQGKVAIITGATKGVGEGISYRFAEHGAKVILAGRSEGPGKQVEANIKSKGGEAHFVRTDISNEEDCRRIFEIAEEKYGKVTTFVHNAAATHLVGTTTPISDTRMDKIKNETMDEIFRSDIYGLFWLSRYALRAMLKNKDGGSIINISSGAGTMGALDMDCYVATKAAMNGITRSMAAEYARANIRVNAVVLGLINNGGQVQKMLDTPGIREGLEATIPLPVMGMPDDIAWASVYFASDESRYVTGTLLPVDGGLSGASAFHDVPLHH